MIGLNSRTRLILRYNINIEQYNLSSHKISDTHSNDRVIAKVNLGREGKSNRINFNEECKIFEF